jgi:hypothetical protein
MNTFTKAILIILSIGALSSCGQKSDERSFDESVDAQQSASIDTPAVAADYDESTSCPSSDDHLLPLISPNKLQININFQPEDSDIPRDYLADVGLPFGFRDNGYSYGWSNDISEGARDRNHNNAQDQRYDTLLHMKHQNLGFDDFWEIEIPNGEYQVKLIAGDPEYCDKQYKIEIENVLAIDGIPSCSHFIENTVDVTVADGHLTIKALTDSVDAKLAFVEIKEINNFPDIAPPSSPYEIEVTSMNNQLLVEWSNPIYDFDGSLIIWDVTPIEFSPAQNSSCVDYESIQGKNFIINSSANRVLLPLLDNNQQYYIKIFSFDENFNYSEGFMTKGVPNPISSQEEKEITEKLMESLEAGNSPKIIYSTFENFAKTHYGALITPQVYKKFGKDLKILETSKWQYISKYSAVIAFETNLPSKTKIEFHKQDGEEQFTDISERFFYNHVHYLKNLENDTSYIYTITSIDEKGNAVKNVGTLTTGIHGEVIEIPGDLGKPPYILEQSDVTYLLTKDITAKSGAIELRGGPVTLDLGGNTVTFADDYHDDYYIYDINKNGMGIFRHNSNFPDGKVTITNGEIIQSNTDNAPTSTGGFNPIYIANQFNFEISGITVDYHTPQTFGMYFRYADGQVDIHHNIFKDRGGKINNRHGSSGGRSVFFQYSSKGINNYSIYNNLIKRTRQNGLSQAQNIFNNEVYVDSWSTNSFAIQPHSEEGVDAGNVFNNKIFLTGYHAIGISWAHENLMASNNFIHMEGINTEKNRWYESFGDQNSLNGLRITNYGSGGQVRNNLHYTDNLIIGNARHGSMIRGTELYGDYSITNTLVSNSIIEINAEDTDTARVSAVVTHGTASIETNPTFYKDTILSSNIANVRFGDNYGRGYNHHFYNVTFNKEGNNPNYHTFIFDGGYSRDGHIIRDPMFTNGARYDDVYWERTGDLSAYSIERTLNITTELGNTIDIYDINNNLVYSDVMDDTAQISVPLKEVTIRPSEWTINSHGSGVREKAAHQKVMHTPHRIIINNQPTSEISITMNETKAIKL